MRYLFLVVFTLTSMILIHDSASAEPQVCTVPIGRAVQVQAASENARSLDTSWTTTDEKVAQVFADGFTIGISPGQALLELRTGKHGEVVETFEINVGEIANPTIELDTVKQFKDNHRFKTSDGRECYGSELNARQPQATGTVSNRMVNPNPLPGAPLEWLVKKESAVVDGTGSLIGYVAPRNEVYGIIYSSKFNHGMLKIIGDRPHVYGFGTLIKCDDSLDDTLSGQEKRVSAWIALEDIIQIDEFVERLDPGTGVLPSLPCYSKRHLITGGNPEDYLTDEGTPLSIVSNVNIGAQPEHYLTRPTGTVNIVYCVPGFGLGGHGVDSFHLSNKPFFRRAIGVRAFTMPTFYPKGHPLEGKMADPTMTFLYGSVEVKNSHKIFGWVAQEALDSTENCVPAPTTN
ncbi:hypothetical protein [Bythopirellula polymerisocia]|uniref:BIG2 domain-containing protein n=1 Tax=Bythopirellula polymerisocia TaxID=2528003 RepID=A0A5C6CVA7_9BACT|nr:hypothetical protein [Bythopirellula polymerisocia]TWU27594.1 hypothetical protein Pla144_23710 [Bythopirellula polymerisocia]